MLPLALPTVCLSLVAGALSVTSVSYVREGGSNPDNPDATVSAPSRIACSAKCAALEEWACVGFWYQANGTCLLYKKVAETAPVSQETNTASDMPTIYRRDSAHSTTTVMPGGSGTTSDDRHLAESVYRDCSDLSPDSPSGVYRLQPGLSAPDVPAYCDMEHDGGGWTVVIRRADIEPRENFHRNWESYKLGFGVLDGEFYWGNEHLWILTSQQDREYQVHIWLEDFDGNTRYALYQEFSVASEAAHYRLQLGEYSGDAGNAFSQSSTGMFSTFDRDYDNYSGDCAQMYGAAWWFRSCTTCQLTGEYYDGGYTGNDKYGIIWRQWKTTDPYSMRSAVMKIKTLKKL